MHPSPFPDGVCKDPWGDGVGVNAAVASRGPPAPPLPSRTEANGPGLRACRKPSIQWVAWRPRLEASRIHCLFFFPNKKKRGRKPEKKWKPGRTPGIRTLFSPSLSHPVSQPHGGLTLTPALFVVSAIRGRACGFLGSDRSTCGTARESGSPPEGHPFFFQ
ncbi:hypothetical protein LY76DRAFT_363482 [Colletotrichum caudatum]|nr:hypothetical protein LY76DRAFT_363482 [Colletotrichum caudatum]